MWTNLLIKIPRILRNKNYDVKNNYFGKVLKQSLKTESFTPSLSYRQEPQAEQIIIPSIYSDVTIPDTNITQYIFDAQEKHAGRIGIINGETGESITHGELRIKCHKVASAFARLGISKGDTVALISSNCPEFVISYIAVTIIGAIISTFNNSFTGSEIEAQLLNAECVAVICHKDKLKECIQARKNNKTIRHIISIDANHVDNVIPISKLLKDDGKGIPSNIQFKPDDVVTLPYSSGTTGLPKGVMLTHRNLIANLQQIQHPDVMPTEHATDSFQETSIGLLPLYHIYGMTACMFLSVVTGSKMVTVKEFNPDKFIESIGKYQLSSLHLVPPLMSFLQSSSLASPSLLSSVRTVFCGAAPVGESLLENFFSKFGHHMKFLEGYGMTETSPLTHISRKGHYVVGSCGPAVPNTLSMIKNVQTGKSMNPGEGEGELCIKGPQVMKGYFKNEKATHEAVQDGWLHTGDIARMDPNGDVFIVDRLKELIKVKGLQVAPAELENILRLHHSIEDVAVIGVPDERSGEVPKAFVVLEKGDDLPGEDDIKEFVASRVANHKWLGYVSFVKEIPKSAAGKILRKDLKKLT